MTDTPVRVDVWSDFVCPWCYLAATSLEKLEAANEIEIVRRSYELRPKGSPPMPEEYRKRIEDGQPQFNAMALERYGITINRGPFGIDSRPALIGAKFAEEQGAGKAYHDAMYRAYWEEARDIEQLDVMQDVAESVGLDREAFAAALETPAYLHQVIADITQAQGMGLQGVPAMIFAGKYLVSGAQPYDVLKQVVKDVNTRLAANA
ncbi:MAG: DsbA family oxidoreductase [Chloroflexi bacterium]|nr:DsbA family oxidoreductase [Chloroflexota bacterium]MCC6892469.1 DsbA family oxidoreductase [Anaerolineae bacterium]